MSSTGLVSLRQRMATPIAVLVGMPLLVLLAGAVVAWVDSRRLTAHLEELAVARMSDAAGGFTRAAHAMVASADPVMDRWRDALRRIRGDSSRAAWDAVLGDLMAGEPTIAWITWYDANGWFRGMRRDKDLGPVLAERGVGGHAPLREWRIDGTGQAQVVRVDESQVFTVTDRPPWKTAVTLGRRGWTAGYTFFDSGESGFSRVEPLYGTEGTLLGVLSVDYSLERLALRMQDAAAAIGADVLLLSADGAILADIRIAGKADEDHGQRLALARSILASPETNRTEKVDGTRVVVYTKRIAPTPGLSFDCVLVAPYAPLVARADAGLRTGLGITVAVILAAVLIAVFYARQLILARREAARARQAADALGAYVLEAKIGVGGMGEVWKARHRRLACPAALKVILLKDRSHAETERIRSRFRREAEVMASLTSPHTVRVFDFGSLDDSSLYYAMELLDGLNCDALVRRRGPLSPGNVVHILLQVCDALGEAHQRGLVHRDLKPSNILVCRAGSKANVVKVVDFGLVISAKSTASEDQRLTRDGFVVGTVGYCSPEQIRGEELDGRSDLYALGCVAFFLLTGRTVFPAEDAREEQRRHLDEPAPPLVDRVAPGLAAILRQCLAKQPDQRPADAGTLRARLLACEVDPDGEGLSLRPDERAATISVDLPDGGQVVRPQRSDVRD